MAVKCILTGQTPSVLDGVTENVQTQLNGKVDKVTGKGLSTNDYTTDEKNKLAGIETGANKTVVDSSISSTSTNPVQNKVVNTALSNKVDKVSGKGLSTNDLTNTLKSNYDAAYTHSTSTHAPTDAEKNVIVGIQKNGTDVSVNSSTRKVNITVPTSASDVGAVPTSRTVNGKALSANITLSASDVSALPDSTTYVSTVDGSSGAITTNAVKYTSQTLTDAQKTQARDNIGAQQKLYNLTLDTPIVENQTIDPNSTYAFSSPITLNEYEIYWIDVQMVYEGKVQNRYQLLSRAVNGDSGITVQWMGYIVLDTTGVTLAISSNGSYIITIAKVLDYEIPVDSTIVYQEGSGCAASNTTAHAEGDMTTASGYSSHAEGNYTTASGDSSHAEGDNTTASGYCSHAEGANTTASDFSHAEGQGTTASGGISHAEGHGTTASADFSHAEGDMTTASGYGSHAEGSNTTASGNFSHAEGTSSDTLPDTITPDSTIDYIIVAHNKSLFSLARGVSSHVEGGDSLALGYCSHVEGACTIASGDFSHAEGQRTTASGDCSHAEGYNTKASSPNQHVQGIYNIEDVSGTYAHIVGNGDSDTARSNAHTLDWNGNAWFAGDVYVGSTSGINKDAGSKKLAKESTTVSATLSASLWSGSSVPYTYTLSVNGITVTSNQELLPSVDITPAQLTALQSANIQDGGQSSGSVTLKAFGEKPTIDIPIRVILRGDV